MKSLFITLSLFLPLLLQSQNFEKYQWSNRLLLIYSEDDSGNMIKEQLNHLLENKEGLKERKLILFQLNQTKYRQVFPKTTDWKTRGDANKIDSENEFAVYLIGLDGGIKLKQEKILILEKLFQTIDSMPMRQAEMRKDNN